MRNLLGCSNWIRRKIILAAIIPTLIMTFLVILKIKDRMEEEWFLCVAIKSSVFTHIQILYDIGNGLNEKDSVVLPITQTNVFRTFYFSLPNNPIQYIGINPLNKYGQFSLKDIRIVNGFNHIIYPIAIDTIQPLQQIHNISIQNNMFTADTEADANDPMLFLDLEYPLMNKVNIIVIGIYSLVAMCCSFLICYTVFYFWVRLFPKLKQFVISVFLRKETLINLSILVIATFVSITIGYIFFVYMKQPSETIIYQGYTNDYALSFYNTKGQKISKLNGPLKLKLDPFTIYANYPNQNSASYSIDSYGFRDTYKDNTDGQIAIVLGGSAAFGQGLSGNNDTFASNLNRLNQKYSIMNAGTVGFLSGQELSQMIHVLDRFSPSLYIVFDGWNDIFDPYSYAHRWPINGGPIGFNNTFFMIENQLATVVQKEQCSKNETSKILPCARKIFKNERKYFKAIISTYISNIDKMNAFANTRKARFLIVFQPELGNKTILSTDEQQILKDWNKSHKYLDRKIPYKYKRLIHNAKKYCKRHNIEYIDINEDPRFSKNPNTLFYDAVHPNEKGHKIIAEIINDLLVVKF